METKRLKALDLIRGSAIFIIVLIHLLQRFVVDFNHHFFASFLVIISVPSFFFTSGVSYGLKEVIHPRNTLYLILKKAFNYFYPFFIFLILRTYLFKRWDNLAKAFNEVIGASSLGLWILWILLWLTLLTDLGRVIAYKIPKYRKLIVVLLIITGIGVLCLLQNLKVLPSKSFIGYDYFLIYTPVYLVGFLLGPRINQIHLPKTFNILILIISLSLIFLGAYRYPYLVNDGFLNYWGIMYLLIFFALLSNIAFIQLLRKGKLFNLLVKNGRFTLEIYFIHLIVLYCFNSFNLISVNYSYLVALSLYLLCFIASYLIIIMSYYLPFLHLIIFGRSYSKYSFEKKFFSSIKSVLTFKQLS